jgi:hypothetical protein
VSRKKKREKKTEKKNRNFAPYHLSTIQSLIWKEYQNFYLVFEAPFAFWEETFKKTKLKHSTDHVIIQP